MSHKSCLTDTPPTTMVAHQTLWNRPRLCVICQYLQSIHGHQESCIIDYAFTLFETFYLISFMNNSVSCRSERMNVILQVNHMVDWGKAARCKESLLRGRPLRDIILLKTHSIPSLVAPDPMGIDDVQYTDIYAIRRYIYCST